MRRGMPSRPAECWIRKVVWNPMNTKPKDHLPRPSDSIRPLIFGNQKYSAANIANALAPNAV
jgi:hypothetical protein